MNKLEFLGMSLHTGLKCNLMGEYTKETEYDDDPVGIICTIEGIEIQSYIGTDIIEIQCTDDDYIHQVPLEEVFQLLGI